MAYMAGLSVAPTYINGAPVYPGSPEYEEKQREQRAYFLALEQAKHPAQVVAQAAPANVITTVSPQISAQVSPQISPNFQQQFQPSGSPMTAGTQQAGQAGLTAADVQRMLDTQAAQAAQAQAAQAAQAQAAQLAAQRAAADQAAQAAFQAAQQGTGGGGAVTGSAAGGSIDNLPQALAPGPTVLNAPMGTPGAIQAAEPYNKSMLLLTALGVIVAFIAMGERPKAKGRSHASRR